MAPSSPPRPLPSSKRISTPSSNRPPLLPRSDSRSNERLSTPTIRFVVDGGSSVYSKSPFPTEPSQRLAPNYATSTLRTEQGVGVSDENSPANASSKAHSDDALVPRPLHLRKNPGHRASTETATSIDADTLTNYESSFSPLSSRFSRSTSPPSSLETANEERLPTKLAGQTEPSLARRRPTIRLVVPSISNDLPRPEEKQVRTSLISSDSSETIDTGKPNSQRISRSENYLLFSSSSSSSEETLPAAHDPSIESLRSRPQDNSTAKRQTLIRSISTESLPFSDPSYSPDATERPVDTTHGSSLSLAAREHSIETAQKVEYLSVRQSSASISWATVSNPTDSSPRMTEGNYRPNVWGSRLSTIASESERASLSHVSNLSFTELPASRRRPTIGSAFSSEGGNRRSSHSDGSIPIPPPLFGGNRQLPIRRAQESDEADDTLGELPSPPLRHQRSGYFSRLVHADSSDSLRSQASQISFIGDLSWAKSYYSSGEYSSFMTSDGSRPSTARLNTATSGNTSSPVSEAFPSQVYRPRTRPHRNNPHTDSDAPPSSRTHGRQVSGPESTVERPPNPNSSSVWGSVWGSGFFSPHLRLDRRNTMALSTWRAPSFDEPFSRMFLSPVNRQVLLFCLGFIFPFAWIIASVLSLPPIPASFSDDPSVAALAQSRGRAQIYVGSAFGTAADEQAAVKRYLKARWWRTLNRIMCVAGLLIIGAIIVLVVISLKVKAKA